MNSKFWDALKPLAPVGKPGLKPSAPAPQEPPAQISAGAIASAPAPAPAPAPASDGGLLQRSPFAVAAEKTEVPISTSRLAMARAESDMLDEQEKLLFALESEISGVAIAPKPSTAPNPCTLGTLQRVNRTRLAEHIKRLEAIHRSLL